MRFGAWRRLLRLPKRSPAFKQHASDAVRPEDRQQHRQRVSQFEANLILDRALKKSTNTKIRCTLINAEGHVAAAHKEFLRSDLVAKYGLLPRDLRKLDVSTHNIVPAILVRENALLVNLLNHRALIKYDSVLLFDVMIPEVDDSKAQSLFLYDLEHKLSSTGAAASGLPYEQRALESILVSVVTSLDAELKVHELMVGGILAELERQMSREQLRFLLVQSKQLSAFLQKATLIRNVLEELVDNDRDMCGLYLTAKAAGRPLAEEDDHSDVEVMLESYYGHCDEIVQSTENLVSNIRSTEEIINILLDSNRNALMLLELRFQIGMLALSCGSAIAALYGMNLKNFLEDSNWGFLGVSGIACVAALVSLMMSLRRLSRVKRMHIYERLKGGSS